MYMYYLGNELPVQYFQFHTGCQSGSRRTGRHNHISVFTGNGKKIDTALFKCLLLREGIIFW